MMIRHPEMKKRASGAAALILLLSGCMLGPDYRRPAVTTPDAFRGASAAITPDKQSIAELKWFEVFQDEQLQELIRTALSKTTISAMRLRGSTRHAPISASHKRISIQTSVSGPMLPPTSYRGRDNLPFPGEPAASAPSALCSSICFPLRSTFGADYAERRKRRAPIYCLQIGTEKPSSRP